MKFITKGDTIFVNIYADSLPDGYDIKIFARFPAWKSIKGYSLNIGFPSGSYVVLDPVMSNNNYAEFIVDPAVKERLIANKIDVLSFESNETISPCPHIRKKDFFQSFLNSL